MKFLKEIIPGFLICFAIAMLSKIIATVFPSLGAASFAILIGIICGNTIFKSEIFNKGSKFSESQLLAISVVLMGGTLNLSDIASVGVKGVIFIVLQMTLTIMAAYIIGRRLGFTKKFCLLMSSGNAVCGSSAIASTAPIINADSKEKGLSITMVNITGTILMFLLPLLAGWLYNLETLKTSALVGGTLQSIGQVIASAKLINDSVVTTATIFKIIRITMLVFVVIFLSKVNFEEGYPLFHKENKQREGKVKVKIPWYIIGFFILCVSVTIGIVPLSLSKSFKFVSGNFEIIALAAIGMRIKFSDLKKEGPKSLMYGLLIGLCQVIFAVCLISIFIK